MKSYFTNDVTVLLFHRPADVCAIPVAHKDHHDLTVEEAIKHLQSPTINPSDVPPAVKPKGIYTHI